MGVPKKIQDAEFIEVVRRSGIVGVARAAGCSEATAKQRRRYLEETLGISIKGPASKGIYIDDLR